jgi:hypothetical protein
MVIATLTDSLAHTTEVVEIILSIGYANLPDTTFER